MNCCMLQLEQVSLASFCQFQWFLYACLLLLRPAVSLLFGFHFSQFMFMGPLYHSSRTWITFCSFFFYVLVWFWSIGTIFSITDILSLCILQVCCSGHGKNGALCVLRQSIRPEMITEVCPQAVYILLTIIIKVNQSFYIITAMPFVKLQDKHNKKSQICLIGRVVVIVELSRTSCLF